MVIEDSYGFTGYSDPAIAMRVWQSYYPQIEFSKMMIAQARHIYELCDNSQDLDIRLESLFSGGTLALGMDRPVRRLRDSDGVPFESMSRHQEESVDLWKTALRL